ncbi:MAG: MarR family transcriptional regulator [Actinomycetota bacterium]
MQGPELTSIFDTVEFRDAYRMSYLTNAVIVPTYAEVRREFGIIRSEYHLLLCLSHFDELNAQDVSRVTRMPRNSISRAVHRMVSEGYIRRAPDPDDARQARLTITAAGRRLHEQVATLLEARQEEVLSPLTQREREQLARLLRKAVAHAARLPN